MHIYIYIYINIYDHKGHIFTDVLMPVIEMDIIDLTIEEECGAITVNYIIE